MDGRNREGSGTGPSREPRGPQCYLVSAGRSGVRHTRHLGTAALVDAGCCVGWYVASVAATSRGVDVSAGEASRRVEADGDTSGAKPSRADAYQWAELMRPNVRTGCPGVSPLRRAVAARRADRAGVRGATHLATPRSAHRGLRGATSAGATPATRNRGSVPGRSRIRRHLLRALRRTTRGVGVRRRFLFPVSLFLALSRTP